MKVYVIPRHFAIYCKEPIGINIGREYVSVVQEESRRMYSYSYRNGKLEPWKSIRDGLYLHPSLLNTTGGEE